jgi:heme exporter protein C
MPRPLLIAAYWLLSGLAFAAAMAMVFAWTPEEETMGVIQKIFYFHLPVAINTFLACTVCFIGGLGYLVQRQTWWDDLAAAGAKVSVVLCTGVLLIVRASVEGAQRRAIVSAVYGLIAYLDIPLVYLSARLLPDQFHPADITLAPSMKWTLAASFVPITLIAAGLIVLQYRLHRMQRSERDARAALPALQAGIHGGVA